MKKHIYGLAMGIVYLSFFLGGCSELNKASGPSDALQRDVATKSVIEIMRAWNSLSGMYTITDVKVDENKLTYTMYPSVRKVIGNNEYEAWPIKVSGSGTIKYVGGFMTPNKKWKYEIQTSCVTYAFVNNVGENRFMIEEEKAKGTKIY